MTFNRIIAVKLELKVVLKFFSNKKFAAFEYETVVSLK